MAKDTKIKIVKFSGHKNKLHGIKTKKTKSSTTTLTLLKKNYILNILNFNVSAGYTADRILYVHIDGLSKDI